MLVLTRKPAEMIKIGDDVVIKVIKTARGAVKIGMLSSPGIIETVAEGLRGRDVPVVLDPVMVAKSGDALLQDAAVETLKDRLLPLAESLALELMWLDTWTMEQRQLL